MFTQQCLELFSELTLFCTLSKYTTMFSIVIPAKLMHYKIIVFHWKKICIFSDANQKPLPCSLSTPPVCLCTVPAWV